MGCVAGGGSGSSDGHRVVVAARALHGDGLRAAELVFESGDWSSPRECAVEAGPRGGATNDEKGPRRRTRLRMRKNGYRTVATTKKGPRRETRALVLIEVVELEGIEPTAS